ncbi:MAG: Peptide methionine sulfoxide reductase [Candidatus Woesebacteria bacterium GW2011_GWA1_37_8]|uniref:Peptide methionine sulfoxide reductase MsrA n=2 Tax=Candidatus Woeseibacteriota TaxID=1752722 RepID=A0A0G0LFF4_9BACT|nr:MAG: Peptide methionine sulfoxide reductase [Microgenomates group bacterium GW2011_GWC1_37_12b]KKQ45777.1 MAG: Peptide methionine sulfoxide reductase [Candidatus Woesebacteria bacterium GW2011_GWA1_37_8]KKQ86665.1 MAG: Peptide methionine sulfoxide reductase [Candidatus Woesebacteria bacterium GW2011_GWB1_38_8b]
MDTTTFANGCFWCTEAIFKRLRGVISVVPGYSGGELENPTYEQVSAGNTGHFEAIQIKFDPEKISYEDLLYVFFKTHNLTQKDGQGADIGTQYLSKVFYHNDGQKEVAEKLKQELQKDYDAPIATEILEFKNFYEAENYHKDYYSKNPNAPYCKLVIDPKIKKMKENYSKYLK